MRIKEDITDLDYSEVNQFFENRASKYSTRNPYAVTMYQDDHEELVAERNKRELELLYPKLNLGKQSRVLDIACGIGRWADAIKEDISEYCGVDFSEELIKIADSRNSKDNFFFYTGASQDISKVLESHHKSGKYDVILMIGILLYLNDDDVKEVLGQIGHLCADKAVICIREPIGIGERLTLKDFYSDELKANYNAIYRTKEELTEYFETFLFSKGFRIREEGMLFQEQSLNNRKETVQYYYILER